MTEDIDDLEAWLKNVKNNPNYIPSLEEHLEARKVAKKTLVEIGDKLAELRERLDAMEALDKQFYQDRKKRYDGAIKKHGGK